MSVKISELPAGQVVGTTTEDGALELSSGAADGGSARGIVIDTEDAFTTDGARVLSARSGGSDLLAIERRGGSTWLTMSYTSILATNIGGGSAAAAGIKIDGANLQITIGSNGLFQWTGTAGAGGGFATPDLAWGRAAASIANLTNASTGGAAIQFTEMSAPSAGASDTARLFCRDNGSGKSQLCVIFATGAIQVVATEP